MMELLQANGIAFGVVLLLGLFVAWWVWGKERPAPRRETHDVLSDGAAPAQRNNALIDAPPAAAMTAPAVMLTPPPSAGTMAGIGEVIAAAAAQEIDEAAAAAQAHVADQPAIAPTAGEADDLSRIKGVGPKLVALLGQLGITRYDQIAAWSDADVAAIDARLGAFAGRPVRDGWVEQCGYLARGDIAGFEGRFGKV
ncbi:hypothetical protein [Novosphingobium lentum]|uniref:hypothetical protein n=1 Tax=Novosphingobium lentum TaxID=145287 RepID=UPI00083398B6|nr:hypothetical protein [Novosphingobium lentum]